MKHIAPLALAFALLSACGKEGSPPPGSPARPDRLPNGEPAAVQVQHILISFDGKIPKAKRSQAEAQKLAYEIIGRAKSGEDFDSLVKTYTDDSAPGIYGLANEGVEPRNGESPRSRMVPAFGNVGFRISVNEIAVAEFDSVASPYGWHIIKRLK